MAANAEEFVLRLTEQVSGPATVAQSALSKLEGQIRAEQGALAGLAGSLTAAKAKLAELESAGAAPMAKQVAVIGALDEKLAAARAKLEKLGKGVSLNTIAPMLANVQELTGELEAAKKKLDDLTKAGPKNANAIKSQREKVAGLEGKASGKGADIGKLEASLPKFKALAAESKKAGGSLKDIAEEAKNSDGMIGKLANGFEKLKAAGPAAVLVVIAVALVAVAAAAIAGAIALTRFALASADASRSSRLMSNAAAGGSATGAELEAVISDIASKSPLARDKIAEMGRAMELARLQGRNMQNALEAAATASTAIGDSAGAALTSIATNSQNARRFMLSRNDFTGVSAELEGTGLAFADVAASIAAAQGISIARASQLIKAGQISVKAGLEAMNDAVQKKFGKTVAAQMLSLNTQFAKMKEGLASLFKGVDIEPFLRGLKLITGLFSEQTVTGHALKTLFVSMFNPLAAASEGIFPIISAFLRGMVVGALTAYVAFLRVKAALAEAFGGSNASKVDWIKTAMVAGKYAIYGLGVALFALVGIIALIAAVVIPLMVVLSLPFILAAAVVYGLVRAFQFVTGTVNDTLIGGFQSAVAFISGLDFAAIGMNLVTSLANAITAGASFVIAAVTNLGTSAMSALKGILGIASPSKVFTAYGKFTAEGFADGVEEGTPAANNTVKQLGSAEPSGGPAKGGGGGRVINFADGAIRFGGSPADFPAFRRMFMDLIEQLENEGAEPAT